MGFDWGEEENQLEVGGDAVVRPANSHRGVMANIGYGFVLRWLPH